MSAVVSPERLDVQQPTLRLAPMQPPYRQFTLFRRRAVKRRETLYGMGDACNALFEVHAGCFKTCTLSRSGRHQVTGFQFVGDLVGLEGLAGVPQASEAVALEDSLVNVVPFEVLSQLCKDSVAFQRRFHAILGQECRRSRDMLFLLGSMHAQERLATFLLSLTQRLHARGYSALALNLCMSREEIGSHLGLTLETVSRMFALMRQRGALDVSNRSIRILDRDALRSLAPGPR